MKHYDKKRILVVEDEGHLAEGLKLNLSIQGYEVMIATDGVSALEEWKRWRPDLIVLDIMLPGIDGLTVLQSIRLEDERIPILILTAKSDIEDKVQGLSYGVDDYITKPFHLEEFLLRVERLLKRVAWAHEKDGFGNAVLSSIPPVYTFGKNRIDFETSTARCKDQEIQLTEQEVRLLKLFIARRGKPLSRSQILEIGWGYTGGMTTRTVDNFIVRFRKYFEDNPKQPVYFKSLRSIGYVFDHEEESVS
uniref:Response regulator transcription factor n=1 Tax=Candidatus Desulfatibia profunda TaxID=2841695 RepID=A0A8J6TN68_9BACT|nr:response regulator transcription factor [Candidatus Desulfatibia profunda]